MKTYKCICGSDSVRYEKHVVATSVQVLFFTCKSCGFGNDRTFVFPPDENEKVLYYTCIQLFREMGKDHGFTIDSSTLTLKDPLFFVRRSAKELLEELIWADVPVAKFVDLFREFGINVDSPSKGPTDTLE